MTDAGDGQEGPGRPHWNYRLVRLNEEDVVICEVYYNADGVPNGYIEKTTVGGTNRLEIEQCLHRMFEALNKSVLVVRDGRLRDSKELLAWSASDEDVERQDPANPEEGQRDHP